VQLDSSILLLSGISLLVLFVLIVLFKRFRIKKVDTAFQTIPGLIGAEGKNPGFKQARTGTPQLFMDLTPSTKCTSLIVQYGHSGKELGLNKNAMNVAAYHANQELKTHFFLRPSEKPSVLSPRSGSPVKTNNETFEAAITVDRAINAEKVLRESAFQESILNIPQLIFFEVRQEGVQTLIWGEVKNISADAFKQLFIAIKRTAEILSNRSSR